MRTRWQMNQLKKLLHIICTGQSMHNVQLGNSILEQPECQNFKCIFPRTVMHSCKEDTLKYSGNNFPKVYSVVSGKERLLIFDHWKPWKSSSQAVRLKIEGFGGKRVLGFLLNLTELCQKRSKFRMQVCLHGSNNVLHVFSLKFASFLRYYVMRKNTFF